MRYKIKKAKNGRKKYVNKYGVEFTEKEKRELDKVVDDINKIRKAINKKSKRSKKYKNLGIENPDEIKRRSKNLHQFKDKNLFKAWMKRQKQLIKNPNKFVEEKRKLLKENYKKALLDQYSVDSSTEDVESIKERMGDSTRKLYDEIDSMDDEQFVDLYNDNQIPEINEFYQSPEYLDEYIDESYGDFVDDMGDALNEI